MDERKEKEKTYRVHDPCLSRFPATQPPQGRTSSELHIFFPLPVTEPEFEGDGIGIHHQAVNTVR